MSVISTTRGESLLSAIRNDILTGKFEPGSKLQFTNLISRYEASTGVLREVLPRLVEQGLVTSQPQMGYRVLTLDPEQLEHLTEARAALESQIFKQSIESGDRNWEGTVVAAHHRLSTLPPRDEYGNANPEWLEEHRNFHQALLAGCPNTVLLEMAERFHDVTQVYRCWLIRKASANEEVREDEHRVLTDLAIARDTVKGPKALADHISYATKHLVHEAKKLGEFELNSA